MMLLQHLGDSISDEFLVKKYDYLASDDSQFDELKLPQEEMLESTIES